MMRHAQVIVPYSRIKEALAKILQREGYLQGLEVLGEKTKKHLVIQLKYLPEGTAVITHLQQVSKPSRRIFYGYEALKPLRSGMGTRILTTSQGILSDAQAREKKIGGEVLVEIW